LKAAPATYQTLFFLHRGGAVLLTVQVKPKGWTRIPWMTATMVFNLASSVLFFASRNGLVPFSPRGLPAWLGRC